MGRLNHVVKEIERLLNKHTQFIRVDLKRLVRENDSTALEIKASYALENPMKRPRPNLKELALRAEHPGKFDVVFISKHSKQKQILTKEKGIFYDVALTYFNYITDYGTERSTDTGHYEIMPHQGAYLPEEEY